MHCNLVPKISRLHGLSSCRKMLTSMKSLQKRFTSCERLRRRADHVSTSDICISCVSKGIASVLVFSVMPPHPRGHMSFCAFGGNVILYRQSPDAVLKSTIRATMPAMYARRGRRETCGV